MKRQKGFSLLEVLVALAILGLVATGFLTSMTNATKGAVKTDRIDTSRVLAQGQMEYVKKQPFAPSYTAEAISGQIYPGYAATITAVNAAERDANIQKITVTITYNGVTAATLNDCKVK
jgi:prepilin-type N-terminal cleavage/methylation domain-containing protein